MKYSESGFDIHTLIVFIFKFSVWWVFDLAWLWPCMNLNYKVSMLLFSDFVNRTLQDDRIGSESVSNMSAMHDIAR